MSQQLTQEATRPATPSAVATRGGRVTFVVGGILFVLAAIVAFVQTPLTPLFEWAYRAFDGEQYSAYAVIMQYGSGVLAAAAMIVFAVGARSGGSVVARKPLGMIALVLFALWPFVTVVVWTVVAFDFVSGLPWWISLATSLLGVVAGLIAVIEIVRVGAVPGFWRWLPAIAFVAVIGPIALAQLAQWLGWSNGEAFAPIVSVPYAVFLFCTFIVPFVLGVAAIGLASAAHSRSAAGAAEANPT